MQKINILQKNLLLFFGGSIAFVGGLMWLFHSMNQNMVELYSTLFANTLLFTIICGFIFCGFKNKLNVYETFIEGAKDGFHTAVKIIPYLIAMFIAIAVFRASGAMDLLVDGIRHAVVFCGFDPSFVEALPTMLMKSLSGNGSRVMMLDAMQTFGADSFIGRLTCVAQGSVDTTFYIVALYFGSVAIKNTRYTIPCALLADLTGSIAAIIIAYIFFF
jgi:spore maturation protein SpmB